MSWVKLACAKDEKLVIGRCFLTARVASEREWGVVIDCAACVNSSGLYTKYQHHETIPRDAIELSFEKSGKK